MKRKPAQSQRTSPLSRIENAVRVILEEVGEDPEREGLLETPRRVAKAYQEMLSGYQFNDDSVKRLLKVFREAPGEEFVVLKDIEFTSFCEHHMLPFHGVAHVAYLPNEKIVGLSKLARLVEVFSRRLQVQERLTQQIAQTLFKHLEPHGTACQIEARHLCMSCRGVKKGGATMVTRCFTGAFLQMRESRDSFTSIVNSSR